MATGVKIVKNDFAKRIKKLKKLDSRDMLKKAKIQIKADSSRNFLAEKYADENGNIQNWDKFKQGEKRGTLWHIIQRSGWYRQGYRKSGDRIFREAGQKIWHKRPSGKKYSSQSKLLQDTGRLIQSVGGSLLSAVDSRADIEKVTKKYTEVGSKVKYADAQHKRRPILTISKRTLMKINYIATKFLKGEKI